MIYVTAIKCPKCEDLIYSRTRHDMRYCSCESLAIDGGFDYTKISSNGIDPNAVKSKRLRLNATRRSLLADWNTRTDAYGLIRKDGR